MDRTPWGRALIILGVIALALYLLGQLLQLAAHFGDVIIVFFLAWLLAFVLLPIVRLIEGYLPIGRAGAAGIVYLVLLVCLVTLLVVGVPLLIEQVSQLASLLPTVAARVPGWLRDLQAALDQHGIPVELTTPANTPSLGQEAAQLGSGLVTNTVSIASGIASGLFGFTIILILSFYFVLDGDRFVARILAAIPEHYRDDADLFLVSIDRSFGGFLRGMGIQAAILGLGTAAIMGLAGLHYVLLASIFAGLVIVIPFIGPPLAVILPALIAVFSNLSTTELVVVMAGLVALQLIVVNVVAPKVMSESVGIHPLLVFLALLVGIKEAGIAGAIFGVPIAAVLWATGRILLQRWNVIERPVPVAASVVHTTVTVITETPTGERTVRFERLGFHLGRAVSRLFHARSS
jgi:predicted PurR-regulated permease PerM